jgi:hypothetical protein
MFDPNRSMVLRVARWLGPLQKVAGFREDLSEGAPACRWIQDGVIVDVLPVESRSFGFGNQVPNRA